MMVVRKKNGLKEEFNISKVIRSIENAAKDININLTESDLSNASRLIENFLKAEGREETSSYEIFGAIVFKLKELDYKNVAQSYVRGALGLDK
ncbi:ATP cone domain-containing protein [uncultured Clostridium sp.]|uniref:ATP cone domain-containing protein n=1 Tax=uncultured Clostridium sp. TaxID=59620 RepID=UPI0025CF03A4|nr:ATP cone domain-containing protein [uncultured Clostridium sp.]